MSKVTFNPSHPEPLPVLVFGDSYARRFISFLQTITDSQLQCLGGIGISGATVADLKTALKQSNLSQLPPCNNILIFIGANNVLKSTPPLVFKQQLISVNKYLLRIFPNSFIMFAELPVFPRHKHDPILNRSIKSANTLLRSLSSDRVAAIPIPSQLSHPQYFHSFYPKSKRRDGIHLNASGYGLLLPVITRHILQWHFQ